jgi:hypothetical protein
MDGMGSMDGGREEKMEEWMDRMGWMDGWRGVHLCRFVLSGMRIG